jgi:prepilin-type N-terminal cleavage/methylation domain-containing protein
MNRATGQTNFPRSSILAGEKGFTMVEVIVSLIIMAIVFVFLAKIYAVGTGHTAKQGDRRKASFLANEALEGILAQEFSTIASATPVSGSTITNTVSGYSFFNQTVMQDYVQDNDFTTVVAANTNSIRIEVIISSTQGYQGFHDVTMQNVITNWQRMP